jgi:hypothetical protein
VDTTSDVQAWIAESHELARSFAYDPIILAAVEQPGELAPIELPESYVREAGAHARRRVVAAGLRLAVLLGGSDEVELAGEGEPVGDVFDEATIRPAPRVTPTPLSGDPNAELSHWLNLNGNVRHNSTCEWFQNTKRGRMCSADEGRPCGKCGG